MQLESEVFAVATRQAYEVRDDRSAVCKEVLVSACLSEEADQSRRQGGVVVSEGKARHDRDREGVTGAA